MKNHTILMLGAKGVGKTTLLTLVCEEMKRELDKFGISVDMDKNTQGIFEERKAKIFSMLESTYDITNKLEGTDQYESYHLNLTDRSSNRVILSLCFQDCPGGDLSDSEGVQPRLMKWLFCVDTIIYVMDTPYLIENSGAYHEVVNHAELVQKILLENRNKIKCRDFVVVPIKCEKYEEDIVKRLAELSLEKLIETMKAEDWMKIEILPVHTVGSILFDRFVGESSDGRPNAKYIRKYPNSKFQPKNIELLTRHLLYHLPAEKEQNGFFFKLFHFWRKKEEIDLETLKERLKGMI